MIINEHFEMLKLQVNGPLTHERGEETGVPGESPCQPVGTLIITSLLILEVKIHLPTQVWKIGTLIL